MATVTYETFVGRVRRELEEEYTEGSTWSPDSLLEWTNDAIRDFGTKVEIDFDEQYASSVEGQESYSVPDYTAEVVRVAYDGSFMLRLKEAEYFVVSVPGNEGTPLYYCFTNDTLYLYPIPSTAVTDGIRMWRRYYPEEITAGGDTMPWGAKYNFALSYYVKARAWELTGDFDLMKMNDDLYNRAVDEAIWEQLRGSTGDYFWEPAVIW